MTGIVKLAGYVAKSVTKGIGKNSRGLERAFKEESMMTQAAVNKVIDESKSTICNVPKRIKDCSKILTAQASTSGRVDAEWFKKAVSSNPKAQEWLKAVSKALTNSKARFHLMEDLLNPVVKNNNPFGTQLRQEAKGLKPTELFLLAKSKIDDLIK